MVALTTPLDESHLRAGCGAGTCRCGKQMGVVGAIHPGRCARAELSSPLWCEGGRLLLPGEGAVGGTIQATSTEERAALPLAPGVWVAQSE